MKYFNNNLTIFLTLLMLLCCGVGSAQTIDTVGYADAPINATGNWGGALDVNDGIVAVGGLGEPVLVWDYLGDSLITDFGNSDNPKVFGDSLYTMGTSNITKTHYSAALTFNDVIISEPYNNYTVYNDSIIVASSSSTPTLDFWVNSDTSYTLVTSYSGATTTYLGLDVSEGGTLVVGDVEFGTLGNQNRGEVFTIDLNNLPTIDTNRVVVGNIKEGYLGQSVGISEDGNTIAIVVPKLANNQTGVVVYKKALNNSWDAIDTITSLGSVNHNSVRVSDDYIIGFSLDNFQDPNKPDSAIIYTHNGSNIDSIATIGTTDGSDILSVDLEGNTFVIASNTGMWVYELDCGADLSTASLSASAPQTAFCSGSSVTLTATNVQSVTYQWFKDGSPINGAASDTYTTSTGGNFKVSIYNDCGDSLASNAVTINEVGAPPTAPTISSTDDLSELCEGNSVVLEVDNLVPGVDYSWSNGVSGNTSTFASQSGTYTIEAENVCGTTSSDTTLTFQPLPNKPVISVNGDTDYCVGEPISTDLTSSGNSLTWLLDGSDVGVGTSYTATAAGTYTVQDENDCGTSESDPVNITEISAPNTPTITENGGVLTASATGASSFEWFLNGTTITEETSSTLTPTAAGDYQVIALIGDCVSDISDVFTYTITSRANVLDNEVKMYPNPSSGQVQIETSVPVQSVEVYDVLGQRIEIGSGHNNSFTIPYHGLYFVKVRLVSGEVFVHSVQISE